MKGAMRQRELGWLAAATSDLIAFVKDPKRAWPERRMALEFLRKIDPEAAEGRSMKLNRDRGFGRPAAHRAHPHRVRSKRARAGVGIKSARFGK